MTKTSTRKKRENDKVKEKNEKIPNFDKVFEQEMTRRTSLKVFFMELPLKVFLYIIFNFNPSCDLQMKNHTFDNETLFQCYVF